MSVELIYDARNIVGESIIWDDRLKRLFWIDIIDKHIHSFEPNNGIHEVSKTPNFITSIGLCKNNDFIIGGMKNIYFWNLDNEFRQFTNIESHIPGNRLNEGVVAPDGSFWVGTMQKNFSADGIPTDITETSGKIYRCTADGKLEQMTKDKFGITNTFIWTKTGQFITADTTKNQIYRYDLDKKTSKLTNRKTILQYFDRGLPDGSCIDQDGYFWNCRVVGGSCIARISSDGTIDQVVDLPCSWPTSCTFGGKNFDTLYITSARFTMSEEHLAANPQEGAIFAFKPNIGGLPQNKFG